jgi:DNA-binding transcriptional MerR regulator
LNSANTARPELSRVRRSSRDYGPEAVVRVRNIRRLLEAGLSTDDIRELGSCLERDLDHEPACADAITLYEQRIATVERRIDSLVDVHRSLRTKLEQLRGP